MENLTMFPRNREEEAVRIEKTMHEREEPLQQPLLRERVEIEHVIKNQMVEGPLPIREEGDTVIVPVVKQVLRVEKEWVLTEEIHLKRHREEVPAGETATLQYEEIRIVEPRRGQLGGRLPSFIGKLESASACQDRIESASEKIGR